VNTITKPIVVSKPVDGRPTFFMPTPDDDVRRMMALHGFRRVLNQGEAEFVIFTGGSDINPLFYGELRHKFTNISLRRDLADVTALRSWKGPAKQKLIGICRGAQFLNVMVGNGSLWQHVDRHATPMGHLAYETGNNNKFIVSSTHHQMMLPHLSGTILLTAGESSKYEADCWDMPVDKANKQDVEVVLYQDQSTLCFQPHPEITDKYNITCTEYFFDLLSTYFLTLSHEQAMKNHRLHLKSLVNKK